MNGLRHVWVPRGAHVVMHHSDFGADPKTIGGLSVIGIVLFFIFEDLILRIIFTLGAIGLLCWGIVRINKMNKYAMLNVVYLLAATSYAMPGSEHLAGMEKLRGIPVEKGGVGNMSSEKIQNINRWMDNPASQSGQYINHKAGGKVLSPSNHGCLRHNPYKVGNAMHSRNAMNLARLHKIQDVARNSAPVDGLKITPEMRSEAERILKYVNKRCGLPSRLPTWVDRSGPEIGQKMANTFGGSLSTHLPKLIKVGGIAVAAYEVASGVQQGYNVEKLYKAGKISESERIITHSENISGKLGALAGAKGAVLLMTAMTPFGPVGWIIGATGSVVIVCSGQAAGEWAGKYIGQALLEYQKRNFVEKVNAASEIFQNYSRMSLTPEQFRKLEKDPARRAAYENEYWKRHAETSNISPAEKFIPQSEYNVLDSFNQ